MVGPIANGIGIIAGSFLGTVLGDKIPKNMRERLPLVFGCVSMGLGISMIVKIQTLPPVILALLLGTVIGELLRLENGVHVVGQKTRVVVERVFPAPLTGISHDEFIGKFVAMIVLFTASGTGIFGAIKEGMDGDPSLLIVKAFLDFFTATIFATSLGFTLAVAAIPQFIVQVALFMAASLIFPLTNDVMIADFSAVGGFIMLATGFRICNISSFPVTSMLPAMVLVMPFTHLWLKFVI